MRIFASLAGALCATLLVTQAAVAQKTEVSVGYFGIKVYEPVLWAIKKGKVTSEKIELKIKGLTVPALIQATATRQFDIVQTSILALPLLRRRGLKLQLLAVASMSKETPQNAISAIFVKADSPIKSAADLKGKTVAAHALRATDMMYVQAALQKKYGFKPVVRGGPIKWVELPLENIPSMLLRGKIDAGHLIGFVGYKMRKSGKVRPIFFGAPTYREATGAGVVYSVLVTYPTVTKAKPAAIREAMRMLRASRDYLRKNRKEVFAAVSKEFSVPEGFLEHYFAGGEPLSARLEKGGIDSIQKFWTVAKEMRRIPSYPNVRDVIWR